MGISFMSHSRLHSPEASRRSLHLSTIRCWKLSCPMALSQVRLLSPPILEQLKLMDGSVTTAASLPILRDHLQMVSGGAATSLLPLTRVLLISTVNSYGSTK